MRLVIAAGVGVPAAAAGASGAVILRTGTGSPVSSDSSAIRSWPSIRMASPAPGRPRRASSTSPATTSRPAIRCALTVADNPGTRTGQVAQGLSARSVLPS